MTAEIQHEFRQYDISFSGRRGFRASELDGSYVEEARQYSHIIVICGNNDLSPFKSLPARDTEEVILDLGAFARCVARAPGVNVAVVGLLSRSDRYKSKETLLSKVNIVNEGLRSALHSMYVGPRGLTNTNFGPITGDPCHLNESGRRYLRRIILRVIEKRFRLKWQLPRVPSCSSPLT